ncbi:MAG TPA: hypothetical protein VFO86_11550, partial [Terriglobia bacterium]|nr:hypothetical protein [Terriglobia bacterium]
HVLIEMRETGSADLLINPANRESDVDRDNRRLVSLDHKNGQPIGQPMLNHALGKTGRGSIE